MPTEPEQSPASALCSLHDWQRTFDCVSDAIWVLDSFQRIVRCNRASSVLFDLPPEKMIGKKCCAIVHGTAKPIPDCPMVRMRASGKRESMELQVGDRWYHVTVDPMPGKDVGSPSAVHIIRDITDQKTLALELETLNRELGKRVKTKTRSLVGTLEDLRRANRELRESEERYHSLFNAQTHAVMCFDAETRRFLDVNDAATRLYGYSRDEFLNLRHADITTEQEESDRSITRTLHGFGDTISLRYHRKKDGTVFPVQIWPATSTLNGRTVLCGVIHDLTEAEEKELALRSSEAKFRTLAEHSPNMIFINHAGRVVYANPICEEVMGYTREEFYADDFDFLVLIAPESTALVLDRVEKHMQGEDLPPCEIALLNREGREIHAILSAKLIDYAGETAILGILTDITQRKETERRLLRQQERLRRLTARLTSAENEVHRRIATGLHDEVAQLLTACSLKLAVAARAKSMDEVRMYCEEIDALLIESMEKIRSLSFELASSTLSRLGLREALLELAESVEQRCGVHFEVSGNEPGLVTDEAVSTVLFKAARELFFNVVKHSGAKAARVFLGRQGENLQLVVEDHGVGFEDATVADADGPTRGLGLFEIRERLTDIGGTMRVESEPGVGTRVSLHVPVTAME